MAHVQESTIMDWTDCPLIEVVPGKVSGVPLLKGTRLPADTVLSNYESGSPVEEISDNFDMPEQTIRELLTYASHKTRPFGTDPRANNVAPQDFWIIDPHP